MPLCQGSYNYGTFARTQICKDAVIMILFERHTNYDTLSMTLYIIRTLSGKGNCDTVARTL